MDPKRASTRVLLAGLCLLAAAFVRPVSAQQPPPLPHAFYGAVEVNGEPAPVGAQVEARGAGVLTSVPGNPITVTQAGQYGGPGGFDLKLMVQGQVADGALIEFYVDGVRAQCALPGGPWQENYPFKSGAITELNLKAVGPAATPTLLPTVEPTLTPSPTAGPAVIVPSPTPPPGATSTPIVPPPSATPFTTVVPTPTSSPPAPSPTPLASPTAVIPAATPPPLPTALLLPTETQPLPTLSQQQVTAPATVTAAITEQATKVGVPSKPVETPTTLVPEGASESGGIPFWIGVQVFLIVCAAVVLVVIRVRGIR